MTELLHADLTYKLRGIGFRVYNELGPGHTEQDYETAMLWAFRVDDISGMEVADRAKSAPIPIRCSISLGRQKIRLNPNPL